MKYFKTAFLAAIGWKMGELAFETFRYYAVEICKNIDSRNSIRRDNETPIEFADRMRREKTGEFTVRGFCRED